MSTDKKMSLTAKVLIGMALGIIVGLIINLGGLNGDGSFINTYIVDGLFKVIGKMFVNSLKMLVVPLVFFSLICGICGIGNINALGRVGIKSFALYMLTTAVAIATAIILASLAGIGKGMNQTSSADFTGRDAPPLSDVLINIVPGNPINAMASGDMLPIIFFAILLGISILMVGKKAQMAIDGAEVANEIMMKMVNIIMAVAPYAVFCLISMAVANLGLDLLVIACGLLLGSGRRIDVPPVHHIDDYPANLFRSEPCDVLAKNPQRAVFCFQYSQLKRDDPCNIAHDDPTFWCQQFGGIVHCTVWRDDQHGWDCDHTRCCHRVHRQRL